MKKVSLTANDTVKNGYMLVKMPSHTRNISLWKVWANKWVEICAENRIKNVFSLYVYRNHKQSINSIFHATFKSKNTVILRCRSSTQRFAFALLTDSLPVIYLATNSEQESQNWMKTLRNILWQPNPRLELARPRNGYFYVSIIDNQHSYRIGLIGAYGYLRIDWQSMLLIHPQLGRTLHEWHVFSVTLRKQSDNILEMGDASNETESEPIIFYCNNASRLIKEFNRNRDLIKSSENGRKARHSAKNLKANDFVDSVERLDESGSSSSSSSSNNNNIISDIINSDGYCWTLRTASEIPETVLNSSFSSPNNSLQNYFFQHEITDSSEPIDSSADIDNKDIENIYEELVLNDDIDAINDNFNKLSIIVDKPPEVPPKNNTVINNNDNTEISLSDIEKIIISKTKQPEDINNNCVNCGAQIIGLKLKNQEISECLKELLRNSNRMIYGQRVINDYEVMRPILSSSYDHSDDDYVQMKSFAISHTV